MLRKRKGGSAGTAEIKRRNPHVLQRKWEHASEESSLIIWKSRSASPLLKTCSLRTPAELELLSFQDQKLQHMAELQLGVVSDALGRAQIESQIAQWDDNLERLHCEQFRLRCYMASLQNGELPNPKVILSLVLLIMKLSLPAYSRYTCSHCVVVWSL